MDNIINIYCQILKTDEIIPAIDERRGFFWKRSTFLKTLQNVPAAIFISESLGQSEQESQHSSKDLWNW